MCLSFKHTFLVNIYKITEDFYEKGNGILLYSEEKQQDFFGCLARFLGCPGLREADNPEIWPLRPRWGRKGQSSKIVSLEKAQTTQKSRLDHQKGRAVLASLYNRIFCCIFGVRSNSES